MTTHTTAIAAHVAQLRETLQSLETFIQSQPDLSVFVIADYQDLVESTRDALQRVGCETCDAPHSTVIGPMRLCEDCRANWHLCERCQEPVRVGDAIWEETRVPAIERGGMGFGAKYEARPYHGACASGPLVKEDGI